MHGSMRLFVANINFNAENSDLREFFVVGGFIPLSVKIKRDNGVSRGIAFVEFADREQGQHAIEDLDGHPLMGRKVNVKEAEPPNSGPRERGEN